MYQVLTFEFGLNKEDIFLDTEALRDVHSLKEAVVQSDTVVCLLTKSYAFRPWCMIELYEAIKVGREIKPVNVVGAGYDDFDKSLSVLTSTGDELKAALEAVNPGAYDALTREGYDAEELCNTVGGTLPYLLAKPPSATLNVKQAQIQDVLGLNASE